VPVTGVVAGTGNSSSQDQNFDGGGIVIAELHDPNPGLAGVTLFDQAPFKITRRANNTVHKNDPSFRF